MVFPLFVVALIMPIYTSFACWGQIWMNYENNGQLRDCSRIISRGGHSSLGTGPTVADQSTLNSGLMQGCLGQRHPALLALPPMVTAPTYATQVLTQANTAGNQVAAIRKSTYTVSTTTGWLTMLVNPGGPGKLLPGSVSFTVKAAMPYFERP